MSSGQRLAYTVHGKGPALVCPAWWVSHLEQDWKDAGFRELFEGLAQHHTVIRYDRPGSGLSDRERENVAVADELSTLEELIDQLELERLSFFAVSCGTPPALAYCAKHPHKVDKLVCFGAFLRGIDVGTPEVHQALAGLVRAHWGMGSRTMTNLFAPKIDNERAEALSKSHRKSCSPEMAAQLLRLTFEADVANAAAGVQCPVLVLHRRGDRTVQLSAGRELAASLPNAVFSTLDGDAHVPWMGDVASVLSSTFDFLGIEGTAERSEEGGPLFAQRGEVWTLRYQEQTIHLPNARGLADLSVLLQHPEREIHAGTLWSGAESLDLGGPAEPVLDDEALASYRKRFDELKALIEDAEELGHSQALERLVDERDSLAKELRGAVGLGGRKRGLNDTSQRARKAVTARIRASIKKISGVHEALGEHLQTSISTGMFCTYAPAQPVDWRFEAPG